MRRKDLRKATKKRAERNKNDKNKGAFTKKKKSDSKRMATVASVYETDRFVRSPDDIGKEFFPKSGSEEKTDRPSPKAKRVWAGLEWPGKEIIRKISGAGWSLKGAEALLKLRAIKISGDFPSYWKFHEQKQYERHYENFYLHPSILKIGS